MADTEKTGVVEYIDLTPTWEAILPTLLLVYTDATPQGRAGALEELTRMARAADAYVALQKAEGNA